MEMSKVQVLRALVKQRLSAAAEEIFGLFERTISEYEQELCRSKEENQRHRKLLDAVFQPEVRLHRADVQQLSGSKEVQEGSSSLDQEDPEPPHIKEERNPSLDQEDPEPTHIKKERNPSLDQEDPEPPHIKEERNPSLDQEDPEPTHIKKERNPSLDQEDPEPPHIKEERNPSLDQEDPEPTHIKKERNPSLDHEDPEPPHIKEERNPSLDHEDPEPPHIKEERNPSLDHEDPEPPHIKKERNPSLDHEDPEPPHIKEERNPSLDQEDPEPPHIKEERNPSLDHEDPEPPHIKEEQEELWNCQEGEQLPGLEEADITKFPFTLVSVKSEEDDEEKPQSSQLHQSQTEPMEAEAEGEDCGGPEPARDSDEPDGHLQSETEDSSEPDTEDSADWDKTREPKSGVNPHKNDEVPVSRRTHITDKKWFSCSECVKRFTRKEHLQRHMRFHTGEKRHSCSLCDKRFTWFGQLKKHKCVCPQSSKLHQSQTEQMETEADGEDCGGSEPARISDLDRLLLSETEDATEDSSDIEDSDGNGEKTRELNSGLNSHYNNEKVKVCRRTHTTDKKTFSCSECGKRFRYISSLKVHMRTHTGEKPFSCRVCDRRFTWCKQLKNHKCGDESSHGNQPEENQEAEPRASSSAEQMETEADGEDCGGPEPARNSDQDKRIQTETEDKTEDSSEAEN
ncbi:zinc finger protein 568-like isoform X2 [Micropterus salmoides]|uniref:zinc finger protein 568-like isoform X2 n=1 Tax=Micropterus salmoides TaxID=27706 RepID=UPI0018ED07A2|nr:zinc finger protein 568-like isoform X2 [Micropterus salmoides]